MPENNSSSLPVQSHTLAHATRERPSTPPSPTERETTMMSKADDVPRSISKIPVRTKSSSPARSRSPANARYESFAFSHPCRIACLFRRRMPSPGTTSKIPVPVSTASKGAFRFFTPDDRSSGRVQAKNAAPLPPHPTKQVSSPFTPIAHSKALRSSSAARRTTSSTRRQHLPIVSSDNDSDTDDLQEADLKVKLKEQKRFGRKTGEILNQLHENYEQLLEKYAQAENTIDQLRFQPKMLGDSSPASNASEVNQSDAHRRSMHDTILRASCNSFNSRA